MNRKRILSGILIRDGFIRGWAFDPERASVTVRLESERHTAEATTGFHLPPQDTLELGRPPRDDCGFLLTLPKALFDGFPHRLTVRVPEWRLPTDPPPREGHFIHGDTFGKVIRGERGFTGWVAFRNARRALPPVIVREPGTERTLARIPLTADPQRGRDDAALTARFHLAREALERASEGDWRGEPPHFECAGTALRLDPGEGTGERFAGRLERVEADHFAGWAVDFDHPGRAVDLDLLVDGRRLHSFRPNQQRDDVARHAGIAPEAAGAYGFRYDTPAVLRDGRPHSVAVACARSGTPLTESPMAVHFPRHQRPFAPPAEAELDRVPPPADATEPPQVSVVILNRNGREVLERLLASWRRHHRGVAAELIVIDHDSRDGSREMLERWRARLPLRVIALDYNDSFSASCNRGAAAARGDHLLFLNNDIVWVQDALPAMVATLQSRPVAAVGIKLIKDEKHHLPEVQHLGVRFKLVGAQYWPYEASPDGGAEENEYSPQEVPAATGAVLLCRRRDFERVGGFDERYFYGYEDVEFCLRLSARLEQPILCRNDLVALHRHGHTRLTGRERGVRDHHGHNSSIFAERLGLWLKQQWRSDLLEGRGHCTREALAIGFAVADNPAYEGDGPTLTEVGRMARRLIAAHPRCRVVALTPERDWYAVDDLHLLVVCDPGYDLTRLRGARGDLIRVALVDGALERWRVQRWWPEFDLRLDGGITSPADAGLPRLDPACPHERLWSAAAALLRVAILVPCTAEESAARPESWRIGEGLRQRLQQGGAAAWLVPQEEWDRSPRVADVYLQLHGLGEASCRRREDALNVLWIVAAEDRLSPHTLALFDQLWVASESAAERLRAHTDGRQVLFRPPLPADEPAGGAADGEAARPAARRERRDLESIDLHLPGSADRRSLIAGAPAGVYEIRRGAVVPDDGAGAGAGAAGCDRLPETLFRRAATVHVHASAEEHRDGYRSLWLWLARRMGAEVRLSPRPAAGHRPPPPAAWEPPPEEPPARWVEPLRELLAARLRETDQDLREGPADDDPLRHGVHAALEAMENGEEGDGRLVRAS
ncbi:glycosyltransferase [Endothiovibrio diazotrophicus]